jgi:O-antigen/teichoic acid export membrane protein
MSETKYLAIQDAVKKILSIILFILLARYLTIEDFGKYQQIILIVGLLTSIFSAGIPVAISYFHGQANNYRLKTTVYKSFFYTQLLMATVGVFVFLITSKYLSESFQNSLIYDVSILIAILLFGNTTIEMFKNLSTVTKNLKFFLLSTSSISLVSILVSLTILFFTKDIYYLVVSLSFFSFLTLIVLTKKNLKFFLVKSKRYFINKKEISYVLTMGSVALVSILNVYIDQIMVSLMLPISDYADLRIGSFQIPFIGIITGSLLTVMIPIISKHYRDNNLNYIIEVWAKSIEKASILLVPIVIFCLVFANEIIISFFGDKYIGAVIIFQIYMFQWLRAVVIFGAIMGSIGLEKELFKNTLLIGVLNIIFNYILISYYGVIGAAITTTALNYLALVLLVRKIDTKLPNKFISYFPFKVYIVSVLLSLLVAICLKYTLLEYLNSVYMIILFSVLFYIIMIISQLKINYNEITFKRIKSLL